MLHFQHRYQSQKAVLQLELSCLLAHHFHHNQTHLSPERPAFNFFWSLPRELQISKNPAELSVLSILSAKGAENLKTSNKVNRCGHA